MMLLKAHKTKLEGKRQHHKGQGQHNVAQGQHLSSGTRLEV